MEKENNSSGVTSFLQFDHLFRKNFNFLCTVALFHVNDRFIAEDIVQDFFVDFWQKRNTLQLKGTFEAYARRAIKYSSIDYIRKKEVDKRRNAGLAPTEEGFDPESEMEEVKLVQEKHLRVLEMIEQLPVDRRKILILHVLEGMTHKQIADQLNISVNTVKTQLSRSYSAMRNNAFILILIILLIRFFYLHW